MIESSVMAKVLESEDVDVIIASSPQNVSYTSGLKTPIPTDHFSIFTRDGVGPILVVSSGTSPIIADHDLPFSELHTFGDYYIYSADQLSEYDEEVIGLNDRNNVDSVEAALAQAIEPHVDSESVVAVEKDHLPHEKYKTITEALTYGEVVPAGDVFSNLRKIKSKGEIQKLRSAVSITEAAIDASLDELSAGMTERELAVIFKQHLLARGGEPAFCLIGFGSQSANSCLPGDRRLKAGDTIRFDVGCSYENYVSDIARTFSYRTRDEELARKYDILNQGLDVAISKFEDGADTAEIFDETMAFIREKGDEMGASPLDDYRRAHLGHDIGIDVYDTTVVNEQAARIEAGMVFCVETPYYEIGTTGLQVEDEILVTENGCKRLSNCEDTLMTVE